MQYICPCFLCVRVCVLHDRYIQSSLLALSGRLRAVSVEEVRGEGRSVASGDGENDAGVHVCVCALWCVHLEAHTALR